MPKQHNIIMRVRRKGRCVLCIKTFHVSVKGRSHIIQVISIGCSGYTQEQQCNTSDHSSLFVNHASPFLSGPFFFP